MKPVFGAPLLALLDRVAASEASVLIRGESGVGKHGFAREIHRRSPRHEHPFVKVTCAAVASPPAVFESAHRGTLLLDEAADMPVDLQARLLQVLEDRQVARPGAAPVDVDVRVMATTQQDLERLVREGRFRADVYYRLQIFDILIPPLRERRDEIAGLARRFVEEHSRQYQRAPIVLGTDTVEALERHSWPGNIRELENLMRRLVILQDEPAIRRDLSRDSSFHVITPRSVSVMRATHARRAGR